VSIGLLKMIKVRWACLQFGHRYYHLKSDIEKNCPICHGKEICFQSEHEQAVDLLSCVATEFPESRIIVVADSWFGNNGLWGPLREKLGEQVHIISRLRANDNLFDLPVVPLTRGKGRPRTYGDRLGTTSAMARAHQEQARVNETAGKETGRSGGRDLRR
jgi:hypothetical protein